MRLPERVTITGADDKTSIADILELSAEFSFVEWGILVSHRQEGTYRFPSRDWIDRFKEAAFNAKLQVSTHLCGRWVRELLLANCNGATCHRASISANEFRSIPMLKHTLAQMR